MARITSIFAALAWIITSPDPAAAADTERSHYLAGYAAAVVERDLGLEVVGVRVEGGKARVTVRSLEGVSPQQVAEALVRVEGIERAEVRVAGDGPEPAAEQRREDGEDDGKGFEFLPRKELFHPLLADPRQPHFSASALWYLDDPELTRVGSATFGETFALAGGELGEAGTRWELGLLGGVFSIFDLDASSTDLVNADYWVAPTFSLRWDGLSSQLRVYHQSSHLGDEFLLRNRVERVNLSYEGVDLLLSADLHPALRIYIGGGAIVRSDPDLDPYSGQAGIELQSPVAFFGGTVRPIAAGDFRFREENDWEEDISGVAGLQIENPEISPMRLQILFQYFRGNSPNGQFFARRIESMGVGVHLHF